MAAGRWIPTCLMGHRPLSARLEDGDRQAGAALEATQNRAAEFGIESTAHLVHGDPARAIIDTADEVGADLIVVGNRGVDAAGHYVLSNVPEAVLLGAGCDVLVVHTTDP